jgi:hypothetical protein
MRFDGMRIEELGSVFQFLATLVSSLKTIIRRLNIHP